MRVSASLIHLLCTAALGGSAQAWALTALDEDDLSQVSAQAGLTTIMSGPSLTLSNAQWTDSNGGGPSTTGGTLTANSIALTPLGSSTYQATLAMDVGATASGAVGVGLQFALQPATLSTQGLGLLGSSGIFFDGALQLAQPATLMYTSGSGFFGSSWINLSMPSVSAFLAQTYAGRRNVMILDNGNINATYNGLTGVDPVNGLELAGGTLTLSPLAFDVGYGGTQAAGSYSTAGDSLMQHLGVKGNIDNVVATLRGGGSSGIAGNTTGIATSLSGQLDTNSLYTYLGGAGPGSYGAEFSRFVPLSNYNASNPAVSLGTMTVDVLQTGNVLPDLFTGYNLGRTAAGPGVGLTLRGLNFQAYPSNFDFYNVGAATSGAVQNWSLITALYNTAANAILYPGGYPTFAAGNQRGFGLSATLATQPYDSSCAATCATNTAFLIADTAAEKYIGLRNVDLRLALDQAQWFVMDPTIDKDPLGAAEPGGFRLTALRASLGLKGQLAIGNLPDGTAANNFSIVADGQPGASDLGGVALNLGLLASNGSLSVSLKPVIANGGHYLGYDASLAGLDPAQTNLTLTEPVDGTQIAFSQISGGFSIANGQAVFSNNAVTFSQLTTLGSASAPLEVGAVNFVPLGVSANTQTLGKMVMTGSTLSSSITLSPK